MAKRKKSSKRKGGRRVSGIGNASIQPVLGVAVGALGSKLLVERLATNMPNIKPNIIAAAQIVAGFLLAKARNPMVSGLGLGMIGNGAIAVGQSFGVVSGVGGGVGYNPNLITFQANPQMNGLEDTLAGGEDLETGMDGVGDMAILAGTAY